MALSLPSAGGGDDDDDEYFKYDPFEGIDFDAIPELSVSCLAGERQGEENLTGPTGSVQPAASEVDTGTAPSCTGYPATVSNAAQPAHEEYPDIQRVASPSTAYSDEEYTPEFLAQLEFLESTYLQGPKGPGELQFSRRATS